MFCAMDLKRFREIYGKIVNLCFNLESVFSQWAKSLKKQSVGVHIRFVSYKTISFYKMISSINRS